MLVWYIQRPPCDDGHHPPQEFKPQILLFQERIKSRFECCYSIESAYWRDTVHSRLTWAASRFKDCALSKIASSSGVMFHPDDKQACGVNQHLSKNAIKFWQAPGPQMLIVTNNERKKKHLVRARCLRDIPCSTLHTQSCAKEPWTLAHLTHFWRG